MRLLIVEDEQVTREHLKSMLDFQKLGFTEVMLAANGEEGLKKALRSKPDVVLTDIRMPRMDGITMAEKIKQQLPNCQVIFLSAYAELEYYKAAIRLKTVSYVEKPVAPAELERVLTEAANESRQKDMLDRMRTRERLEKRKNLAYKLSLPNQRNEIMKMMSEEVEGKTLSEYGYVTTMLLSFRRPNDEELFLETLADWVECKGETLIYTKNSENCYIIQVLTREVSSQFLRLAEERLCMEIGEGKEWYLAVGDTVTVGRSYQSYQAAVVGMQTCFFEPYGYVAYPKKDETDGGAVDDCAKERQDILDAITRFSVEDCRELEASLFRKLLRQKNRISGKIRGMYCDPADAVP
ncbi:MAG: response regulator [Lachnospiraceae bacterium]|nr:response regulator [Lachnospiraceae bacterium]